MARLFVQMSIKLVVEYEEKENFKSSQPIYLAFAQHFADGGLYPVSHF